MVLPVGRIGGDLLGVVDDTVDNIYLFNLMTSLDQSNRDPVRLAHLTLPHFLDHLTTTGGVHWYYAATDEGMTRGQDEGMAVSVIDPPPATHHSLPSPNYVLIIDQFEEIITTHSARWPNRADFFRQLEAAMVADPSLWVVLTLREDFVAALDPYAPLLSDKLRARYYMQRMGIDAARAAISRPAAARGRPFADDAAELLLHNLRQVRVAGQATTQSGQYIEPVQLQVVCYQLWAQWAAGGNNPEILGDSGIIPTTPITIADVQKAGDVDRALQSFYEATLVAALQAHPVTGGERRLRDWVEEHLITEAGTRSTVYRVDHETAGLANVVVDQLESQWLLRSESRAGGRWVELTHDRFVQPIQEANHAWEARQSNPLAAVTRLWLENNRDSARLLTGQQLQDIQAFAAAQGDLLRQEERDFLAASTQAEMERLQGEAAAQGRRTRNLWRIVAVVALLALLALIATGFALEFANRAATAEAQAQSDAAAALQAKATADLARRQADDQRAQAEVAKATAQAAEGQAQQEKETALQAQAMAEAARQQTAELSRYIRADQLAQTALVVDNQDQLPQRALLLAVEAAGIISPPIPSVLQSTHNLLGRIGGLGYSGHEDSVSSVAFSPDGQTLASASGDQTIRLWSLANPSADPVVLRGHEDSVSSVAFSPDGQTLASASYDQTIRLWRATAADLLALACATAGRNLSVEEWQRYFPEDDYRRTCDNQPLPPPSGMKPPGWRKAARSRRPSRSISSCANSTHASPLTHNRKPIANLPRQW
ncbi:MAG: hypothetical protein R3C14_05475 [Caldilineaceae bacterium]